MIDWIIGALVGLAILFSVLGWKWESSRVRPKMPKLAPLVSVIIPAYNSEKSIEEAIKSAKSLNYSRKEIIVVNDTEDKTPEICRRHGVTVIQNKKRHGKANALNIASSKARGDILFFLDADTVVEKDCINKLVPWFSDKKIAVVSPRYLVKNENKLLTKLTSMENYFLHSLFKTHMFFGSLIAFRGCGVAVRRNVFDEVGGWPATLIEDNDFAAKVVSKGYNIHYEPEGLVKTREPETLSELKRQRFRWGKGATFTFFNHRKTYNLTPQFFTHIYVYLLMLFAVLGFFFYQTALFFIPIFSAYVIYTLSIREFLVIASIFFIPLFTNLFTSVSTASITHLAILTYPGKTREGRHRDLLLIIPYTFFYVPIVVYFYLRGMISGVRDKKNKKPQLNLKDW